MIDIEGLRATGRFKYLTEQPKLLLDKRLGIKTRGARTIKEDIFVERLAKQKYGVEAKVGIKSVLRKEKEILDITGLEFKGGFVVSREAGKGVVKKIPYKQIESITTQRYLPSLGKKTVFVDKGKTTLLKMEVKEAKAVRGGLGKRSSQQYLEQLYASELKAAPVLKPISPKVITTPTKEIVSTQVAFRQEGLPLMVGGTGLTTTPYAGQGVYEVQEVGAIQLRGTLQPSFIELKVRQEELQPQIEILRTGQRFIQPLKEEVKSALDIKSTQKYLQPQKEALKETQLFRQVLQLKEIQIQKLTQRQIQKARQIQKPIEFKQIIPIKLGDLISKVKKIAKEKPEVFEAWSKVLGREKKIGTFGTQERAEEKLGKFLKKELSAAGFLTKAGKKLKASELKLLKDVEFRKSKLSEFLVVEKKEKRLRKATTGQDIQYFRTTPRKGRKKGKSLFGI